MKVLMTRNQMMMLKKGDTLDFPEDVVKVLLTRGVAIVVDEPSKKKASK